MPITFSVHQTPGGKTYVRTHSFGVVTGDDAETIMSKMRVGAELHGAGVLSVSDNGTDLKPEARRVFTEDPGTQGSQLRAPVAIVLTSAPLRVMMSFVIRVSGSAAYTKFFSNEDEAKQWLHERLDAALSSG